MAGQAGHYRTSTAGGPASAPNLVYCLARPAAPQCSAATEIVELATTRGGVRTYGIFVEDAALRLALSAKEAGKRLTTYRCAAAVRQSAVHAAFSS